MTTAFKPRAGAPERVRERTLCRRRHKGQNGGLLRGNLSGTLAVVGSQQPNYEPQAVSCASTRQCLTAGFSNTSVASRPGAAIWNGRTMKFQLVPGAGSGELFSISCHAVNRCMAVGFTKVSKANPTGGLAEFWNGRRWKLLPLAGT